MKPAHPSDDGDRSTNRWAMSLFAVLPLWALLLGLMTTLVN